MSIKDDCLRHKIFIQRYARRESNVVFDDLKKVQKLVRTIFTKEKAEQFFNNAFEKEINNLLAFAKHESEFNAKLYSKYLKKKIEPVIITKDDLLNIQVKFHLKKNAVSVNSALNIFRDKKIAQLLQAMTDAVILGDDPKEAADSLFNGMIRVQLNALLTTIINCVSGKVRVMF